MCDSLGNSEQLYLLEVLVDRIEDNEGAQAQGGPYTVKIQFLNFPGIDIEQEGFEGSIEDSDDERSALTDEPPPILPPLEEKPPEGRPGSAKRGSKRGTRESSRRQSPRGSERVSKGKGSQKGKVTPKKSKHLDVSQVPVVQSSHDVAEVIASQLPPGNRFSTGKSCLFPMRPLELVRAVQRCPINVYVKEGDPPLLVGQTKVRMTTAFIEAITLAMTPVMLPVSAFLEESYPLTTLFDEPKGAIKLFVRLSCFGSTTFSNFNISTEDRVQMFNKGPKDDRRDVTEQVKRPADSKNLYPVMTAQENILEAYENEQQQSTVGCGKFAVPIPWKKPSDKAPEIQVYSSRKIPPVGKELPKKPEPTLPSQKRENPHYQERKPPLPAAGSKPKPPPANAACTCPKVPELLIPSSEPGRPEAFTTCECATILAALTSVQNPKAKPKAEFAGDKPAKNTKKEEVQVAPVPIKLKTGAGDGGDTKKGNVANQLKAAQGGPPRDEAGDRKVQQDTKPPPTPTAKSQGPPMTSEEPPKQTKGGGMGAVQSEAIANAPPAVQKVLKEEVAKLMDKKQRKKQQFKNLYEYTVGMYPGIHIGHKYCLPHLIIVPKSRGWLWDLPDHCIAPRRGWRPGAISKKVAELIRQWKRQAGLAVEDEPVLEKVKKKVVKRLRPGAIAGKSAAMTISKDDQMEPSRPTLHLHKKDGIYYVSMFPTRADSDDDEEEPQPIQFKVDPRVAEDGEEDEAASWEETTSSSSGESMEIEFTAPSALKKRKHKVDKVTVAVQCEPPEPPQPPKAAAAEDHGGKGDKKGGNKDKKGGKKGGKKGKKK